jgi:hypothetical protein
MHARFAIIDITPSGPVALAGYTAKHGSFTRIDSPLKANLASLMDQDGRRIVLGRVDTLFINGTVLDQIPRVSGLPGEQLIPISSRTHDASSPAQLKTLTEKSYAVLYDNDDCLSCGILRGYNLDTIPDVLGRKMR